MLIIQKEINNFIVNDSETKLKIKEKYYNILTNKNGILLENGLRIEDNKFLNNLNNEKVIKYILKKLDNIFECIINPEKNKYFKRQNKINRILKNTELHF